MVRPESLNPIFHSIRSLNGVGDKTVALLNDLCKGALVKDLLFHLPYKAIDRSHMPPLVEAKPGSIITVVVKTDRHEPPPYRSRRPYRVYTENDSGYLTLVFFNVHGDYLTKTLPVGQERLVSGKVEQFDGMLQMVHPDIIASPSRVKSIARLEPQYPLAKGLTQKKLVEVMSQALSAIPDMPEWIDRPLLQQQKWTSFRKSLQGLHRPEKPTSLSLESGFRQRLAYDELLAYQLALGITRNRQQRKPGRALHYDSRLAKQVLATLPFHLTAGQEDVLKDIRQDLQSPYRMIRLLQGDVGAGKTIVGLLAMLNAIEAGTQTAFMAPTEILARQQLASIQRFLRQAGLESEIHVSILTGREKGKAREEILAQLENGDVDILVGTHALFQQHVNFADLGLVVIDEQHRFGVKQRLQLTEKGEGTNLLLMTATPIPRTLTMTLYGDMDVSFLKDKPAGRREIDTRTISLVRMEEIESGIRRVLDRSEKIYWVCPLIEGSEDEEADDTAAAEERYKALKKKFGKRVGLVHGRMKSDEKDATMLAFRDGDIDVLVATTVIEVGVDVPDATLIVIERAEKFGLSQLHQLRGRVGRNEKQCNCLLLYGEKLTESGKKRLEVMKSSNDGFYIAEEDLSLRGAGEVLGTKQSGFPSFRLAVLPEHSELLKMAFNDARYLLEKEANLESERGKAIRYLLYLFEYDKQIRFLQAG